MDPVTILGAVGSVVGIAAFGLKIAVFVEQFSGDYREAGEILHTIFEGIEATHEALEQIRDLLLAEEKTLKEGKEPQLFTLKALRLVKKTSDKCLKIFWMIEAAILRTSPTEEEIKVKLEKFHLEVKDGNEPANLQLNKGLFKPLKLNRFDRWRFAYSLNEKLERYNRQLDRQQCTLILLFQVISLKINMTKPDSNTPYNIHVLFNQIPQTALLSGIPEIRKRRQSSYIYPQGAANPLSSRWYEEGSFYPSRPLPPQRRHSRYQGHYNEPPTVPREPVRRRSVSGSPDRGRRNPDSSRPNHRRRHSLSGDEMDGAKKAAEKEQKADLPGHGKSEAERLLEKKVQALEAIIAMDHKIGGRKNSDVVEIKPVEVVPGAKNGEPSTRPRFTQSPTRMDEDELDSVLDSIMPQRGSYRGSVVPEKNDSGRPTPRRPVRYQKPSVTDQPVETPPDMEDGSDGIKAQPMVFDLEPTETILASEDLFAGPKLDGNPDTTSGVNSNVHISQTLSSSIKEPAFNQDAHISTIPSKSPSVSSAKSCGSMSFEDMYGTKEPFQMGWKDGQDVKKASQTASSSISTEKPVSTLPIALTDPESPQTKVDLSTDSQPGKTEKTAASIADAHSDADSITESDYAYGWASRPKGNHKVSDTVTPIDSIKISDEVEIANPDRSYDKIIESTAVPTDWSSSQIKDDTNPSSFEKDPFSSEQAATFSFGSHQKHENSRKEDEIVVDPSIFKTKIPTPVQHVYSGDQDAVPHSRAEASAVDTREIENTEKIDYNFDTGDTTSKSSMPNSNQDTTLPQFLEDIGSGISFHAKKTHFWQHETVDDVDSDGREPQDSRNAVGDVAGVSFTPGVSSPKKANAITDLLQNGFLPVPEIDTVADSIINDWAFAVIAKRNRKKNERYGTTTDSWREKPNEGSKVTSSPDSMALILHPDRAILKRLWEVPQPYQPTYDDGVDSVANSVYGNVVAMSEATEEIERVHDEELVHDHLMSDDATLSPSSSHAYMSRPLEMERTNRNTEGFSASTWESKFARSSVDTDDNNNANIDDLEPAGPLSDKMSGALPIEEKVSNHSITPLANKKDATAKVDDDFVAENPDGWDDWGTFATGKRKKKKKKKDVSKEVMDTGDTIEEVTETPDIVEDADHSGAVTKTNRKEKLSPLPPSPSITKNADGNIVNTSTELDGVAKGAVKSTALSTRSSVNTVDVVRKPWYKRAGTKRSKDVVIDETESGVRRERDSIASSSIASKDSSRVRGPPPAPSRSRLLKRMIRRNTRLIKNLIRPDEEEPIGFISVYVIKEGEYHEIPDNGMFESDGMSKLKGHKGTNWWKEYAFLPPKDLAAVKAILEEDTKVYKKSLLQLKHMQKAKLQFWSTNEEILIAVVMNEPLEWIQESESRWILPLDRRTAQGNKEELHVESTPRITEIDESDSKPESLSHPTYESQRLYLAYTIRVLFPQDMRGDISGITCQREPFSEIDIIEQIARLNGNGGSIIEKKINLMPAQNEEIKKLLTDLVPRDQDVDFAWTLAQLEDHDGPGQRSTTVYLKRQFLSPKTTIEEDRVEAKTPVPVLKKAAEPKPATVKTFSASIPRPSVTFTDQVLKKPSTGTKDSGKNKAKDEPKKTSGSRSDSSDFWDDIYSDEVEPSPPPARKSTPRKPTRRIPSPPSSVDVLNDSYPGYGRGYPSPAPGYYPGGPPRPYGYAQSAYSGPQHYNVAGWPVDPPSSNQPYSSMPPPGAGYSNAPMSSHKTPGTHPMATSQSPFSPQPAYPPGAGYFGIAGTAAEGSQNPFSPPNGTSYPGYGSRYREDYERRPASRSYSRDRYDESYPNAPEAPYIDRRHMARAPPSPPPPPPPRPIQRLDRPSFLRRQSSLDTFDRKPVASRFPVQSREVQRTSFVDRPATITGDEHYERRNTASPQPVVPYARLGMNARRDTMYEDLYGEEPGSSGVPAYDGTMTVRKRPVINNKTYDSGERSAFDPGRSHYSEYGEREPAIPLSRPHMPYPEHYDGKSFNPLNLNDEEDKNNIVQKLLKDWTPAAKKENEDVKGKGKEGEEVNGSNEKAEKEEEDDEEDTESDTDDDWSEINGYGGVKLTGMNARPPPEHVSRMSRPGYYEDDANYYPGDAYTSATKDWATVDVPPRGHSRINQRELVGPIRRQSYSSGPYVPQGNSYTSVPSMAYNRPAPPPPPPPSYPMTISNRPGADPPRARMVPPPPPLPPGMRESLADHQDVETEITRSPRGARPPPPRSSQLNRRADNQVLREREVETFFRPKSAASADFTLKRKGSHERISSPPVTRLAELERERIRNASSMPRRSPSPVDRRRYGPAMKERRPTTTITIDTGSQSDSSSSGSGVRVGDDGVPRAVRRREGRPPPGYIPRNYDGGVSLPAGGTRIRERESSPYDRRYEREVERDASAYDGGYERRRERERSESPELTTRVVETNFIPAPRPHGGPRERGGQQRQPPMRVFQETRTDQLPSSLGRQVPPMPNDASEMELEWLKLEAYEDTMDEIDATIEHARHRGDRAREVYWDRQKEHLTIQENARQERKRIQELQQRRDFIDPQSSGYNDYEQWSAARQAVELNQTLRELNEDAARAWTSNEAQLHAAHQAGDSRNVEFLENERKSLFQKEMPKKDRMELIARSILERKAAGMLREGDLERLDILEREGQRLNKIVMDMERDAERRLFEMERQNADIESRRRYDGDIEMDWERSARLAALESERELMEKRKGPNHIVKNSYYYTPFGGDVQGGMRRDEERDREALRRERYLRERDEEIMQRRVPQDRRGYR